MLLSGLGQLLIAVNEQAMPVSVDILGAHLQAYAELQPVLNTLRLCNRFGKGDHAAVSQLPIELVNVIEDYLLETTRDELRQQWTASLICWTNRCSPADHITLEERIELYYDFFDGPDHDEADLPIYLTELNDKQLEDLNDALLKTSSSEDPYRWLHEDRKEDWLAKTGSPTAPSRGIFSRHASLMKRHFGLEIHISHTQLEPHHDLTEEDERRSTSAYLTLLGYTKFQSSLGRREERTHTEWCCEDGPHPMYCSTENGIALPVAIPSQLSKESLARFNCALKVLRLSPMSENGDKNTTLRASGVDAKPSAEPGEVDGSSQMSRPRLMFIMRVDDRPSDSY